MFPLKDENPTELTPIITIALVLVNVAVWVYVQGAGLGTGALASSVCTYGAIPAELTGRTGGYAGVELGGGVRCVFGGPRWVTLLTSMFLHGSWLHLIGNLWFLWLFGNNIEDSMGHLRYLVFYLLVGGVAGMAHVYSAPASPVPTVGASGAISGVMGAYLLLYPRVRVQTLFIFFIIVRIIAIPAWFVLAEWFILQLLASGAQTAEAGGVAYWAHLGGFAAGAALVIPFRNPLLVEAKKRHEKLDPKTVPHRGWW